MFLRYTTIYSQYYLLSKRARCVLSLKAAHSNSSNMANSSSLLLSKGIWDHSMDQYLRIQRQKQCISPRSTRNYCINDWDTLEGVFGDPATPRSGYNYSGEGGDGDE